MAEAAQAIEVHITAPDAERAVEMARTLGLKRVLVTADDDNVGSIKTIEKNGGVLESIVAGPDGATPKRRYWIATADQGVAIPKP